MFEFRGRGDRPSRRRSKCRWNLSRRPTKPFNDKDVAKQVDQKLARTIGSRRSWTWRVGRRLRRVDGQGKSVWMRRRDSSASATSGKTFVYVVDASDSMNERGKFQRARYELIRSLEQLSPDQRYFVIFYNDGAYPMDADSRSSPPKNTLPRPSEWINDVRADRRHEPAAGAVVWHLR